VGLVHLGEGGVAGGDVAAVCRLVGAEDVEEDGVAARPRGGEEHLFHGIVIVVNLGDIKLTSFVGRATI